MKTVVHYHLCPGCFRATPAAAKERYCLNDGHKLLQACPGCNSAITSPHARYCQDCGRHFGVGVFPTKPP